MKIKKPSPRSALLGWFAYCIGGWNANAGSSPGRLVFDVNIDNDEEVVRYLLKSYKRDVEVPLKNEIDKLKVRIFDLQEKLDAANK